MFTVRNQYIKAHAYAAPDQGIFERGGSSLAVIYSITNFLFLMKLYEFIQPHLLEKRGLKSPEPPSGPGPVMVSFAA